MPAQSAATPPPVLVRKYGGSSLATVDRIRAVAADLRAARDAGFAVVVVVSAMGRTTDELADLARQASPAPPRRELDMLLSVGERITMSLLSMALDDAGCPAISFTGSQCGIITDTSHTDARILEVRGDRVRDVPGPGLHRGGGRLPGRQPREGDHHPRPRRQRHHGRGAGRGPGRGALRDPQGRRRGDDRGPGPGARRPAATSS